MRSSCLGREGETFNLQHGAKLSLPGLGGLGLRGVGFRAEGFKVQGLGLISVPS